jgi:hypothetical protein
MEKPSRADAPTKTVVADVIEPGLLDLRGASAFLSLSAPSVRAEMHAGRLHARRFGRKPLFQITELRRYAASLPSWEPND